MRLGFLLGSVVWLAACGGRGELDPAAVRGLDDSGEASGGSGAVAGGGGTAGAYGGAGGSAGIGASGGSAGEAGSGGTGAAAGSGGSGASGGSGGGGLDWYPCPSAVSYEAECTLAPLPADYEDPSAGTVDVHVKRFPSPLPSRGQVWLLQGGPGGDGESIEFIAPLFWELAPDLEVYLPDHRGTGRSTYLSCPEQQSHGSDGGSSILPSEALACADAVEASVPGALDHFTVTAAAEDLGALIDLARKPGDDAFVWGVSYGTYWAMRYMQVRPAQATGVVLDSVARPAFSFTDFDVNINEVAKRIFDACGEDPFCNGKLGSDPWAWMGQLAAKLEQGHCPTWYGLNKSFYKQLFAMLMVFPFQYRSLLPALAYRIDRCEPKDELAITRFVEFVSQVGGSDDGYSRVVRTHIGLSELYTYPPPSLQDIVALEQGTHVSTGATPAERELFDAWPMYARDAHWGGYPATSVPVLMLNGTLDAQTVIWEAEKVASHFQAPHQTFVSIPRATHGVINESPLASDPSRHCGAMLLGQFLGAPTSELDTSCVNEIAPLDFRGETGVAMQMFDDWDAWGDEVSGAPSPAPLVPPVHTVEELRRKLRAKGWYGAAGG